MTDTNPGPSEPQSQRSPSSSSQSESESREGKAWILSLASVAVIGAGWLLRLFPPSTPWWAPPVAVLIASMGASERARLAATVAGAAVKRLRGRERAE